LPKYACRVDANQSLVVGQCRAVPGWSVAVLSSQGEGIPDILLGALGRNYLFELKDPKQVASKRVLTGPQVKFHGGWMGQVNKVETFEEILAIVMGDE